MSGAARTGGTGGSNTAFSTVANIVGCSDLSAEEELSCIQNVPALRIQSVLQSGSSSIPGGNNSIPRFGPVIDNSTAFANSTARLEQGLIADVVSCSISQQYFC
jgi:hypothetical protein